MYNILLFMSLSRLRLLRMRMTLAVAAADGQQKNKQELFDRMNINLLLVVADRNTTSLVSVGRKRKDTMMGYGGGKNKATQELPMSKLLLALDMMNTVILQQQQQYWQ